MLFPVYTLKHREDFMDQKPFASLWLAAGESGFASKSDWQEWADKQIASVPCPPLWLIDLSTTNDRDGLWKALPPAIDAEEHAGFERESISEAVLGYLWLRYERGDIDLQTCLSLAGRHADAYETSIECERFYSLLNRLEESSTGKSAVKHEVETLFGPFVVLAQKQWAALREV